MKILNPSENIGRITSMVANAKKFVVIVSPYNELAGWDKLKAAINHATASGIPVHYYVRKEEGRNGLEGINVKLFGVAELHAKMFFNESEALISSGNLTNRPDINWVYLMKDPYEYKELVNFFETYIKPVAIPFQ